MQLESVKVDPVTIALIIYTFVWRLSFFIPQHFLFNIQRYFNIDYLTKNSLIE